MQYLKTTLRTCSLTLAVLAISGSAWAGHTPNQLEKAGFYCFNAGPSNFTHCLKAEKFGYPAVPVKVFTEDGNQYLGTELLLREDVYKGQPCPQDGLGFWDDAGNGYFACHHFYTDQH